MDNLQETNAPVARVMYNDSGVETDNLIDCDLPVGTLLYTTPPTATALVADFKRRCVEAIRNERLVDDTGTEDDEAYNTALNHAENAIESMPLIGEK